MNKKILLFSIFIIIAFVLFIFFMFFNNKGAPVVPKPTPVPKQGMPENYEGGNPEVIKKEDQSFLVGQLVPKLPYTGKNFSLYYNITANQFILYLNPASVPEGNAEFDAFLKQNGVEDRLWIENLTSTNQKITPAP